MILAIRSEVVTIDPSLAPLFVSEKLIPRYFQVALATILVYHAITTLDKEVKYFWGARLNAVTIVYFANRYIGIFGAISFLFCNFSAWTSEISYYIIIISIDYILMIRVLALYSQSRRLTYILKTLLGIEAIIGLVIGTYGTVAEGITVLSLGPEGPTLCGVEGAAPLEVSLEVLDWAIPIVYGVILMTLAFYKAAEFWKLSRGFKGLNLVKILIVDQVIYFVLVVACCVLYIIVFKLRVSNNILSGLLQSLGSPSILCVLGSNMLFNLKEAGEQGLNQGTSYTLEPISAVEFA